MGENVSRTIIKNILKGRTCSNCARQNRKDYKHCKALQEIEKSDIICSQWMMGPAEKMNKMAKHKQAMRLKRKQKRLNAKNSIYEESSTQSTT